MNDGESRAQENHRYIESFETWLENNSLRPVNDAETQVNITADQHDTRARFQEYADYQEQLHQRWFKRGENDVAEEQERREMLQRFDSLQFTFVGRQETSVSPEKTQSLSPSSSSCRQITLSLRVAAETCETVYVSATRYNTTQLDLGDSFRWEAVQHVVNILLQKSTVEDSPNDLVVDCCRLAHYLQNDLLLEQYVSMLVSSVDTENCLSLSQLADQLSQPRLLERSLSHMMESMDQVKNSMPDLLTKELQDRIACIQSAIQSSIHGNSQFSNKIYFSSLQEYIAIFAERVQYYQERLTAAKEQRDELLQDSFRQYGESNALNDATSTQRGRFVDSPKDRLFFVSPKYLRDLQIKIKRQEQRVATLEIALREQKKLFGNYQCGQEDCHLNKK